MSAEGGVTMKWTAILTIVDKDGNTTTSEAVMEDVISREEAEQLSAATGVQIAPAPIPPGETEDAP